MHEDAPRHDVRFSAAARRALSHDLPASVAAAAFAFIRGPLRDNPRRVGKELQGDLSGFFSARRGEYRVIYRIEDDLLVVHVVRIAHRRDTYRR